MRCPYKNDGLGKLPVTAKDSHQLDQCPEMEKGAGLSEDVGDNQLHLLTSTPGPPAGWEGNEEQKE